MPVEEGKPVPFIVISATTVTVAVMRLCVSTALPSTRVALNGFLKKVQHLTSERDIKFNEARKIVSAESVSATSTLKVRQRIFHTW